MLPRQPLLELLLSLHKNVAATHRYSLCIEIYGSRLLLDAVIGTPCRYVGITSIVCQESRGFFFQTQYTFYCIYETFHGRLITINTSSSVTRFLANRGFSLRTTMEKTVASFAKEGNSQLAKKAIDLYIKGATAEVLEIQGLLHKVVRSH